MCSPLDRFQLKMDCTLSFPGVLHGHRSCSEPPNEFAMPVQRIFQARDMALRDCKEMRSNAGEVTDFLTASGLDSFCAGPCCQTFDDVSSQCAMNEVVHA